MTGLGMDGRGFADLGLDGRGEIRGHFCGHGLCRNTYLGLLGYSQGSRSYIYIHKVAEALQEEYVKITITQVVRNTVYTICLTGLLKLEPGSTTEIVKTTGVGHANHWHTASKRNADYCHNLRRDFILAMV
jgi:hypothetical protein